eukprot:12671163-Alexandrium_andersonii.AAC.1
MASTRAAVARLQTPSPTGRRSLALCRVADCRPCWRTLRLPQLRSCCPTRAAVGQAAGAAFSLAAAG